VNEFVEECRREWKRLGVPDAVAHEMAAELAADLEEAAAEGVSAEAVLGSGAFDPRSFATAWATERGLIQQPLRNGQGLLLRSRIAAAIGAFALIAIIGAVLVIVASASTPRRLTLASPVGAPPRSVWVRVLPPPPAGTHALPVPTDVVRAQRFPGARTVAVDINDSSVDTRTIGSVLLTVGLVGVVPMTIFWLLVGPGRSSRRRTHIDDGPSGSTY
jgi:hypothetical protein